MKQLINTTELRKALSRFLRKHIVKPRFICLILGHKKSVKMFNEDEYCIYDKGCPRCKQPLMLPAAWKNCPPSPGTSKEDWKKFQSEYFKELRASINGA